MPETEPKTAGQRSPGELNSAQRRHLSATCKYIDNLLCDMERALHSAASQSPFPRYVLDITPAQAGVIEDHIRRLRAQLLRTLAWQHLKPDPPVVPVTRLLTTDLAFADVAIEELKPKHLKGYGAVPADAADELNATIGELRSVVKDMERYVRHELGVRPESKTGL